MSISARLYIEDKEYNILKLETSISQKTNYSGLPCALPLGGYFEIVIETTKDNTILDWMLQTDGLKDAKIVIPSRFGTSASRIIELKEVYCVAYANSFKSTSTEPMTTRFKLSPGGTYENGTLVFIKHWHKEKPVVKLEPYEKEDKEKKMTLTFNADSDDIKKNKFGFDKFDKNLKAVYTGTTFSKFENEYNPLQVFGDKYYPIWVSMRKGQTITLKIETSKKKNPQLFEEIKFVDHPDFTFEPANLKGVGKVNITCNNTGSQTQIKVEGDGEVVGAVNFFYPEPKTVSLDWRFVELVGGKYNDYDKLIEKIKATGLIPMIEKYFKPLLIDIAFKNLTANTANLTSQNNDFIKHNILIEKDGKIFINRKFETFFTDTIQKADAPSNDALTLYFVNRRCMSETEIQKLIDNPEDGYELVGGFSAVGTGIAYGVLDDYEKIMDENIIHELLHSLGLHHTFKDGKHLFEKTKTKNYMDYKNTKETIWAWQWQEVHNWLNTNTKFLKK
jgi:Hemolysin coregulated protein Hcp (TssD)